MDKVLIGLGAALAGIIIIGLVALLGGTIVYWIWPHVVPVVLPGAVAAGTIAGTLAWWKAVLLTWMCGILFKGSGSSSSSSSK